MNKQEYRAYELAVARFFDREGIANLSTVDGNTEPDFSWGHCECCGSHLGGDRYDCSGFNPTTKEVQGTYSVCPDCVYYAEYGQLDDTTMMEIEENKL